MSHNIFFNELTGKHSFFSVKEKAWHKLGDVVTECRTSLEAMQLSGQNFGVIKNPLTTSLSTIIAPDGQLIEGGGIHVPDYYATVRTDNNTVLGVVGKDYEVVQNAEAFAFFDRVVGEGNGIQYETAGVLGKGEQTFITAKLPDYIRVGNGDDVIEKYLFITNSHDGKGSITAAFTPVRIVCENTLSAALRNMSNVVRIRHTRNAKERLENAHKVMGMASNMTAEMGGIFNQWAKVRITDADVKKLIRLAMAPNKETLGLLQQGREGDLSTVYKNACEQVFAYGMTSDTQQLETTKGTLYGAYNSITGYFQNVRRYSNDEAKVKSILMGGTASIRMQTAFNLCTGFEKSGNSILQFN